MNGASFHRWGPRDQNWIACPGHTASGELRRDSSPALSISELLSDALFCFRGVFILGALLSVLHTVFHWIITRPLHFKVPWPPFYRWLERLSGLKFSPKMPQSLWPSLWSSSEHSLCQIIPHVRVAAKVLFHSVMRQSPWHFHSIRNYRDQNMLSTWKELQARSW